MKSRVKNLVLFAVLCIVVLGVSLSGCSQESEQKAAEESEEETPTTTSTSTVESSVKNTGDWCSVGSYSKVTTQEGMSDVKITGFEKFNIEGNELTLCCGEIEVSAGGEMMKRKICYDEDVENSIMFVYNAEKGEYVKKLITYVKDGKSCTKMFDENGNVLTELCEG